MNTQSIELGSAVLILIVFTVSLLAWQAPRGDASTWAMLACCSLQPDSISSNSAMRLHGVSREQSAISSAADAKKSAAWWAEDEDDEDEAPDAYVCGAGLTEACLTLALLLTLRRSCGACRRVYNWPFPWWRPPPATADR